MRLILPALVVLSAVLAGCGFHLRGATELPAVMARTELQGAAPESPVGREVTRALQSGHAQRVGANENPTAVLQVSDEQFERRVASVDAEGKVSEYELRYVLKASLFAPGGETLVPEQSATVVRTYRFDSANVLGSSSEEELLKAEMRRQGTRQLLRQINTVLRRNP